MSNNKLNGDISSENFENYEKHSLLDLQSPAYLNMESINDTLKIIEVRIEFLTIGEVDTMNEKFQAQVKIKSRWYENELIENYDSQKNWNPKLFIENALHDLKEEINYKTTKVGENKTMITETRISKGTFWERMELKDFPSDIQELSITFSTRLRPSMVKLISDTQRRPTMNIETLHTFRDQQKFRLYRMVKISEIASYDVEGSLSLSQNSQTFRQISVSRNQKRSKFVCSCFCSRKPGYYLVNVYSFNLLITVLSLTLFTIDTKIAQNRLSGTFTLILTSFSFKVVTSKTLPTISYLTSLDKYQIANIVYLVMCCVWHSVCVSLEVEYETKYLLDKIILCCFATIFILIQVVFTIIFFLSHKKLKVKEIEEEKFKENLDVYDNEDFDD